MWWALAYAATLALLGYGLWSWLGPRPGRALVELAGASLLLGLAAGGLGLFWLSLAGLEPSRPAVAILLAVAAGLVASARRWRGLAGQGPLAWPRLSRRQWAAVAALAVFLLHSFAVVAVNALGHVNFDWDGYILWGFKARVVTAQPVGETGYFTDPSFAALHPRYPLLLPFLMAGVNGLAGHPEEVLSKLPCVLFYLAFGLLLGSGLRRFLEPLPALALLALAMGIPPMVRFAGASLADVPLAAFLCGAVVFLLTWLDTRSWRDLTLAAVFAAAAAFTKNEGLALLGPLALAVAAAAPLRREPVRWRHLLLFAAVVAVVLLPWVVFRHGLPRLDEDYPARLQLSVVLANLPRLGPIAAGMGRALFGTLDFNLLWHLLALLGLASLGRARGPALRFLWTLLLAHLTLYTGVYMVSPHDPVWHLHWSLDRLLLHLVPACTLAVAAHWRVLAK